MDSEQTANAARKSRALNKEKIKRRITARYYRALDYLSVYIFIIVVYGGAVASDYLLFIILWGLLKDDVQKYPLVASGLDYARIGLALLFISSAVIHGVISTYSQVKLDLVLSKEGD